MISLFQALFFLVALRLSFVNSSKEITDEYNVNGSSIYQKTAIDALKEQKFSLPQNFNRSVSSLLCVIFLNTSKVLAMGNQVSQLLHSNVNKMSRYCDFALLSYTCNSDNIEVDIMDMLVKLSISHKIKKPIYHCVQPTTLIRTVTKPMMYLKLLPYLKNYHYVWLLDEDISVERMDVQLYMDTLKCSFYPRYPPLITQPVIYENSQVFDIFNHDKYSNTSIVAMQTPLIEIQMPFLNSLFFSWFVQFIISPFLEIHSTQDCGIDALFCRAGEYYYRYVIAGSDLARTLNNTKRRQQSNKISAYRACAVITAPGTAVNHFDMKTYTKDAEYHKDVVIQLRNMKKLFPLFFKFHFLNLTHSSYLSSPHEHTWEKIKGTLSVDCLKES